MTVLSINQPAYLPWLGYFSRIMKSDIHVVLDHVQFEKNSFTNRNKILSKQEPLWLTIPVLTKGLTDELWINKLNIDQRIPWRNKHWKTIEQAYSKKKFWKDIRDHLFNFYSGGGDNFNMALKESTQTFLDYLEIDTPIVYSSEMNLIGKKNDLVLEICHKFMAKTYISGALGRDYLDQRSFEENNIRLVFDDYLHPEYDQGRIGFVPFMSILDLIVNCGKDSIRILKDGK